MLNMTHSSKIDVASLSAAARNFEHLAPQYRSAQPFPHIVMDNLLPSDLLNALVAELPEHTNASGCLVDSKCFGNSHNFHRSEFNKHSFGHYTRAVFALLRSPEWVRGLQQLTGIQKLFPDKHYSGSGVHMAGNGGYLQIHADFNYKDQRTGTVATHFNDAVMVRRVNTLFYLNPLWDESFGGHMELWDRQLKSCVQTISISPFGRYLVFTSNDFSFHGHPTPMKLPRGRMRRALSLYYYTKESFPVADCEIVFANGTCAAHGTLYQKKPKSTLLPQSCSVEIQNATR
mmetsp:Transcript_11967/g.20209  ORF Transcript_11967/g.20209 Transcript_11967/m.20209 type:complete len:288 (+) Transcript_11967:126-989(+)